MFNKVENAIIEKIDSIEQSILTKIDNLYNGMAFSILDFGQTLILIYMCWCCFSLMMNRDRLSIPPFSNAKPLDGLFFNAMFYFVLALIKSNYDWGN